MWALTWCERVDALVVNAWELDGQTKLMHHYQESLVRGPSCFGDLENTAFGLVTISKLPFSLYASILIFLAFYVFCFLWWILVNEFSLKFVYILIQVVRNIWFLYVCASLLICTHYMYMYNLVLMIFFIYTSFPYFWICFASCICNFYPKLINIHVYLESLTFMQIIS